MAKKMTSKQAAVLGQIARDGVTIFANINGKGVRVLDAIGPYGAKVNLQVDWLVKAGYAVKDETVHASRWVGQPVRITNRGESALKAHAARI